MSNSDNLGAVLDPRILAWIAREEIPFLSEVADRTEADRKGGHLARAASTAGSCCARSAQVPDDDARRVPGHLAPPYFNTNNLWVDLQRAAGGDGRARRRHGPADDRQPQDRRPERPARPRSFQLETAMGAAVGVFDGARALRVPRTRFAPVKTTSDLLVAAIRRLRADGRRAPRARREPVRRAAVVALDDAYYKRLRDFDERFAAGAPSLVEAERLKVVGDVRFGAGVVVKGSVTVEGPACWTTGRFWRAEGGEVRVVVTNPRYAGVSEHGSRSRPARPRGGCSGSIAACTPSVISAWGRRRGGWRRCWRAATGRC